MVSPGHQKIVCNTCEGLGADHFWYVTIDGQTSGKSENLTNYARPNVVNLTVDPAQEVCDITPERYEMHCTYSTNGGTSFGYIQGTDFGLQVAGSYFEILLDGEAIDIDGLGSYQMDPTTTNTYAWLEDGFEYLAFVLPELIDENHTKTVEVRVDSQLLSDVSQTSNVMSFSYHGPVITDLVNTLSEGSDSAVDLHVEGFNFGSSGTLFVDGVAQTKVNYWHHNEIYVSFDGTSGNVTLEVGELVSNLFRFYEFSPILITTCSDYYPEIYNTDGTLTDGKGECFEGLVQARWFREG